MSMHLAVTLVPSPWLNVGLRSSAGLYGAWLDCGHAASTVRDYIDSLTVVGIHSTMTPTHSQWGVAYGDCVDLFHDGESVRLLTVRLDRARPIRNPLAYLQAVAGIAERFNLAALIDDVTKIEDERAIRSPAVAALAAAIDALGYVRPLKQTP